ncbi:stearoyl-CoA desaturase 5-like [Copidosoma floridanum]|uniref:stearoyl-CoA desaturase 5-like n=1 Tax=Copidosoma floridanum TaxID=29053 RepID=UPI0006C9CFD3|nr:stearoyl-CoA desaturase 5-like [Copidosoma floridanum]
MPPNATCADPDLRTRPGEAELTARKAREDEPEDGAVLAEDDKYNSREKTRGPFGFKTSIKWSNTFYLVVLHSLGCYYLLTFPYLSHWRTVMWGMLLGLVGGFGVTGGAHRYWTHRSYKANLPMRVLLMLCYCSAGQNSIYDWVRDHRVHHRYSETDADPHNSNRGFFFAHVGWLMLRKHPEVIRRGNEVDMSDITADPVVKFAQKYFVPLKLLLAFVLPVAIPVYLWNESWYLAAVSQCFMRYMLSLNFTWSVNSAAHLWGNKPYDKSIGPAENRLVSFLAVGEGWHNYHHVFPWDYKAAEVGYDFNLTTGIIDFFALVGWAYDRKQPSRELVESVVQKRGDGSQRADTKHR